MNYRVVKQFWVSTVDNFFNFFYKIVDFIKIWADVFWAFLDIWYHFFAIFGNLFLYIYYIFLFIIDKTTESGTNIVLTSRLPKRVPFKPQKAYVKDSYNPIPAMYGVKNVAETVATSITPMRTAPKGTRTSIIRTILSALRDFIELIIDLFRKPVKAIGDFAARRMKPVKEEPHKTGSLIEEYMKEYEQKRK
jgi:hypothetical protein